MTIQIPKLITVCTYDEYVDAVAVCNGNSSMRCYSRIARV